MIRLIRELRQRRVFRGAGYYLLSSWGLLQVGDVIVEPAGLPGWSMTALLYLLILGFPVAMVLSWRYDIGEHGIVRTRIDDDDAPPKPLGPVDYLLVIGLLVISGGALYQLLPVAQQADQARDTVVAAPVNLRPNSIAVLPFADMSQPGDQQFLGDGISDTVMHVLSQISGLSVTARTSSFAFKDKDLSVTEIAGLLSVAHVLEGSVQKAGDKVRIIARLIDARVGSEVWSGYYDRALDSVFAIQDEIAREVATALTTEVLKTGDTLAIDDAYRPNLDAYEKFILGKQQLELRTDAGAKSAKTFFEDAVALDPGYALAHVYLGRAFILGGGRMSGGDRGRSAALESASAVIARALDLNPLLAEAHAANAQILVMQRRFPEAEAAIERALELQPSNADAYATHAGLFFVNGDFDPALVKIRRAIELDPQENRYRTQLAQSLWAVSRAEEAVAEIKEAIERNPGVPINYAMLGRWSTQLGDVGRGAYWAEQAREREPQTSSTAWSECMDLIQLWAFDRAIDCVNDYLEIHPGDAEATHYLAVLTDDPQLGLSNARKAVAENPRFWYRRFQLGDWLVRAEEWQETIDTLKPVAPGLFTDPVEVNDFTAWAATNVAQALIGLGQQDQADAILTAALEHIERRRKLQAAGVVAGVEDVQYLLLLGREDEALERLRRTVNAGWRFYSFGLTTWLYDSVRGDPRFEAAVETVRKDLAEQLAWFEAHRDDPVESVGI